MELGLVALAHNILKVAGIHQLLWEKNRKSKKASGERNKNFFPLAFFQDLSDSPVRQTVIHPIYLWRFP